MNKLIEMWSVNAEVQWVIFIILCILVCSSVPAGQGYWPRAVRRTVSKQAAEAWKKPVSNRASHQSMNPSIVSHLVEEVKEGGPL